jgi:hypothetical protein
MVHFKTKNLIVLWYNFVFSVQGKNIFTLDVGKEININPLYMHRCTMGLFNETKIKISAVEHNKL